MPLSQPIEREKKHHRKVDCEGYLRADGLWDIEAHMVDRRTYDCGYDESHRGGIIPAGEPVHDMWLRLTIDLDFVIHEVEASSDQTPYGICPQAAGAMKKLVGLRIATGWMKQVRERIGNHESCTHLMDLLGPISATSYQTLYAALVERESKRDTRRKPPIIDTCLALSSHGEVVRKTWPEFYQAPVAEESET